jgi:hypothetical protein
MKFREFLAKKERQLLNEAPGGPMGGPSPGGPSGGPSGGPPGGIGGPPGGLPPMPGGGGGPPPLPGGPPMGGDPSNMPSPVMKLKSQDVWHVLEKILGVEDDKK